VAERFCTREFLARLPEDRQTVLMGLAGIGLPASNSLLAKVMAEAGFPQARAWAANPRLIQEILLDLKARGLAEATPRGAWTCADGCLESAARMAFARGALRRLHQGALATGSYIAAAPDGRLRCRAELRLEFMEGRHDRWLPLREGFARDFGGTIQHRDPLALVCAGPFDPAWFEALDPGAQAYGCQALLQDQVVHGRHCPAFLDWLEARTLGPQPYAATLLQFLVLQGRAPETGPWMARQTPAQTATYAWAAVEALAALAAGDPARSAAQFGESLARLQKAARKRNLCLPGLLEPFHILALLGARQPQALRLAQERIALLEKRDWDDPLAPAALILRRLSLAQAGAQPEPRKDGILARFNGRTTPLTMFLETLAAWLAGETLPPELPDRVLRACEGLPLGWFSAELAELRDRLAGRAARPSPLLDLIPREAPWERVLASLQHLGSAPEPNPAQPRPLRLAWLVTPDPWSAGQFQVEAREQKQDPRGKWGKGRPVSLRRLREETRSFDYLSLQDQRVLDCIRVNRDGWRGAAYEMDGPRALETLVGHPLVFWAEGGVEAAVELLEGRPELRVKQAGEALELSLEPRPERGDLLVVAESPRRRRVYRFTELHRRLEELLGEGLRVPASAHERALRSLAAVAPMVPVRSDLGVTEDLSARAGLEPVAGCPDPSLLLVPAGSGLRVQLRVHPLAGGPAHPPGQGGAALMLEQDGRRLLVRRELQAETRAAAALLRELPALDPGEEDQEWLLQDPERCLDLLLQIEAVKDRVPVLWPEGRQLQAPRALGPESLRLKVASGPGWLELEGGLQLDPERVLDLKAALELLETCPGRFLPLGGGAYLALTQAFRRRLQDLAHLGEQRGRGLRLPSVAALALEELGLGDLEGDRAWTGRLARIRRAMALDPPVPPALEADLRPYQEEGFRWMMRLAEAGLGACLADDMGLGKTVEALALLLARGPEGPALVVAPTSVCANWEQEAARFAPGLRVLSLAGPDRAALLDQAGPMDLVLASYALLHLEAGRLHPVSWATVVLDEAQNIKNAFTKRSQSAMALKAGFRLALSGTPLENHLGELWNLFRFLNPGLLGSLERFRTRFQVPVERDQDPEALARLRRLTGPFLLRRTKAQVLEELPPRTEITLELEPSPREAAFLEALRQRSLEQLDREGALGPQGQALQVLAAITRLRRACCSPELVQPGLGIKSSKLEAFLELVAEIRANRHRALVFSQFVDHLALLRRALDREGIACHYLDGSTPARDRAASVTAFQQGDRELFLISLKAGGTGLNLTGADYVIHMDPWWNPAVEDQASDRAHRIGQARPVTIYRLVLKGSIEQKIVSLHAQKRQLADQLLEQTGSAARLDAAALLELLRT